MTQNRSDKNRLITNASVNMIGFAAQVAVVFFLLPILIGGLGERRYGVWSLVESVLAYLTVLDLGLTVSVVRYVAKFEANADRDNLNRVFSTSLFLFGLSGLLVLAISLGLALLWPDPLGLAAGLPHIYGQALGTQILAPAVGPMASVTQISFAATIAEMGGSPLGMSADLIHDVRWLFLLLGFNVAIGFPLGVYSAVLAGLERYPAIVFIRTLSLVIRAVVTWAVIHNGGGLVPLALIITGFTIGEQLVMVVAAKYYLPALHFAIALVRWDTFHNIRGYSIGAFVAMIAGRISFQTDALVIGAFMLPEHITYFVVGARLVAYAKDALRTLTAALLPVVSALEARNDYQAIQQVLIKGSRYVLYLAIPIQLGFVLLGKPFLSLWLGEELAEKSYAVLVILSAPLALVISQSISGRILYGIGQLRWYAIASVVEALVNLALSLAWVNAFGIEGVAWGTAIPSVLFNIALLVYVCRTLKMPLTAFFRRSALVPVLLAPVPALCWWGLGSVTGMTSWPVFLTVAAAGWLVHGLLILIVERGLRIGAKVSWSLT